MSKVVDIKTGKPIPRPAPATGAASPIAPTPDDFAALTPGPNGVSFRAQLLRLLCMGYEINRYSALSHIGAFSSVSSLVATLRHEWGITIIKYKTWNHDGTKRQHLDTWKLAKQAPLRRYYNMLVAKGYRQTDGGRAMWPL